ncbi:hypothetical protein ACFPK1_27400 [Actinomycetospora rhizophila]|uniref:Uncharacterized protein n=1 Tax=Actinomycetospora rhizophila TaxID=1416876 RepID=A0ABV9ZNY0_9PSEU
MIDSKVKLRRTVNQARWWAVVAFVGAIALASLALAIFGSLATDAVVANDVVKAAIQVLGVAVVGGVVAFAVSALQRERVERYEELRRDADRFIEDRRREDDFLLRVHDDTISSYNEVKKTRRMCTGAPRGVEGRTVVPFVVYEASISEINEQQLIFERMARQVPLMGSVDLYNRTDSQGARRTISVWRKSTLTVFSRSTSADAGRSEPGTTSMCIRSSRSTPCSSSTSSDSRSASARRSEPSPRYSRRASADLSSCPGSRAADIVTLD